MSIKNDCSKRWAMHCDIFLRFCTSSWLPNSGGNWKTMATSICIATCHLFVFGNIDYINIHDICKCCSPQKSTIFGRAYALEDIAAKTRHGAAIIHMILNNLDPRVAQFPQELVTYGGNGQVFSNWAQVSNVMYIRVGVILNFQDDAL